MTELNHLNGGLGVWPMCPCGEPTDGGKWATGLGRGVGDGAAFAFPVSKSLYVRLTLQPVRTTQWSSCVIS